MDGINQGILNEVAALLTQAWKNQLNIPRPATKYGSPGVPGPVKTRGFSKPYASGRLYKDIQAKFVNNPQTGFPELKMMMPIEGDFVAEGRRPGRYPPIGPIDKWVLQKAGMQGIRDAKGRFIKRKSLVYLIRRSIGLYGYGGNDFIIKGYTEVAEEVFTLYGEAVAAFVQFQLDQYIDNLRNEND